MVTVADDESGLLRAESSLFITGDTSIVEVLSCIDMVVEFGASTTVCASDGTDIEVYDEALGLTSSGGVAGNTRCCLKSVATRPPMERISRRSSFEQQQRNRGGGSADATVLPRYCATQQQDPNDSGISLSASSSVAGVELVREPGFRDHRQRQLPC